MAYNGKVKYLNVPFGEAMWSEDILSPFTAGNAPSLSDVGAKKQHLGVDAPVWDIIDVSNRNIVLDEPGRDFHHPLQCVIIGASKQQPGLEEERIHYTLIVSLTTSGEVDGMHIYERVGVGLLEKRHIALDSLGYKVRIQ
jgi:hypothetical protein